MRTVTYTLFFAAAFLCAGPFQSEEAFFADLEETRNLMARGEWAAAKEKVASLLEAHREKPYVKAKQAEIEDCIKTCVFCSSYDKPEPDAVMSGELLMYNRSADSIKIRYTPERMRDFKKEAGRGESKEKDLYIHPALFSGPYTVEIKGSSYPVLSSESTDTPPTIEVCREGGEGYSVVFGFEIVETDRAVRSFPGCIHHGKGIEGVVVCKGDTPVRGARSFKLKVKVGRKDISAYCNGRRFLRAKKPDDLYGGFAIRHIPFDEVLVQGKIQPAWLQALCDKAVQTARAEFEKTYEPERHLPEWMMADRPERSSGREEKETLFLKFQLPGTEYPKQAESVAKAVELFEKGEYDDAMVFLEALPEKDIHEAAKEFLLAILLELLGDYRKALDHCNRVCHLDPDFLDSRTKRAVLHAHLRQEERAIKELREQIDESPGEDGPYCKLARILLSMERYAEARDVVYRAARAGLRSDEMDQIDRLLAKSLNGPTWQQACDIKTQHYHIMSNIDRKACLEAARILEDAYFSYTLHLQKARGVAGKKFRVYLFAGESSYKAYLKDLRGVAMEHT